MDAIRELFADFGEWWGERPSVARWTILGGGAGLVVGLVIAVALIALSGGGSDTPEVVATPVRPSATADATEDPTPVPIVGSLRAASPAELDDPFYGVGAIPPAPEVGPPTVGSLSELHNQYGEAPDATLGRLRIPVLGVDAALGTRYVSGSAMPNPTGPGDVVWYDFSEWPGLGGVPGAGGNAIFSGHVDYFAPVSWAEAIYRGRGVFFNVGLLSPGDIIEVQIGGNTLQYAVAWREEVSAGTDGDWSTILSSNVGGDSITLITCGGEFDITQRSYNSRVVVRAQRV